MIKRFKLICLKCGRKWPENHNKIDDTCSCGAGIKWKGLKSEGSR